MSKIVSAVFDNRLAAAAAADALIAAGFGQADISILMSDKTQGREFNVEVNSKAPEGATVGATAGGLLGAVAATLVAVGILIIPGLNLVAAGPVVAAFAGAGAGGALGGLLGGLAGMGMPEHEAKLMAERLAQGGILVGVIAHEDRANLAKEVLSNGGGAHVRQA